MAKIRKIMRTKDNNLPDAIKALNPVYCSGCGRYLCYEAIQVGILRMKCRHCKGWTTLDFPPPAELD